MQVYQVLLKCKGTELSFLMWDGLLEGKGCFYSPFLLIQGLL